jgi:hypothetical protein
MMSAITACLDEGHQALANFNLTHIFNDQQVGSEADPPHDTGIGPAPFILKIRIKF